MAALMRVPFLDVRATYLELSERIDSAVRQVLESGWYILGEEVVGFESEFARYCHAEHCVGVATGLDALAISLRALGVGVGDEVIVPANTFIATWLAVAQCGAHPIPVDPKPGSCLIDAEGILNAVTPRTRAVIPVHLYGHMCDIRTIASALRGRNVSVLEDAAQAHGAHFDGFAPGAHSHATAWSFYPGKNLGAFGDAGAVTTNDPTLAERVRLLRNYGSTQKYVHEVAGTNSRLDPIQAAVLRVKLGTLDEWNGRRRAIASLYRESFRECGEISFFDTPHLAQSSWHLFVIRHRNRDELRAQLLEHGVETVIHYPTPPHLQGAFAGSFGIGDFPEAESQAREVLSLPIGPHLTMDDAKYVADAVRACV